MPRQKITTFLWFDNQAEEAAQLYTSIFADSRIVEVTRYGEGGPGPKGTAMTVVYELAGQQFIALNGGPQFKFTEAISLQISCGDQQEVDDLWSKLSTGGEEGPAAGSRTSTASPGRSCRRPCRGCCATPIPRRRSG